MLSCKSQQFQPRNEFLSMSVFIFCSSYSVKTSNIVLHVYCCVAAVSSADRLVTLCSGLALATTVTEYLGCFFIPYVDSTYTISFAPQLLGFSSLFCAITLIVHPTIEHCFSTYFWRFWPFFRRLTYNRVPWEWEWMEHPVSYAAVLEARTESFVQWQTVG